MSRHARLNAPVPGFVDPFKISFTVAHGKISHFFTDFEATTCPGLAPSSTSHFFEFPSVKIRTGHFSDSKTLHEHTAVPKSFGAPSCTLSQPFSLKRVTK